jgi:large subunit ribosomal protein L30
MENRKIAVIRIRGTIGVDKRVENTFQKLRLFKKNGCVIIDNRKDYVGMLNKVKDYATWGEINEETFQELLLGRGKLPGNKPVNAEYIKEKSKLDAGSFVKEFFGFKKNLTDIPGLKNFFRLGMPRHGFERKGIKVPYSLGGVLGYRKDAINDLIKRMI